MYVQANDPSIARLLDVAFGGASASRKPVKVTSRDRSYQVSDYWSEGSRNYAAFVELATMRAVPATAIPAEARQQIANPFGLAIAEVPMSPGYAVVEHCIFQGKDLGYRVFLHPANMAPLLQAKPSISDREKQILDVCKYKAGYRKERLISMNVQDTEIDSLVMAGYLSRNRAGAISVTINGRNALEG